MFLQCFASYRGCINHLLPVAQSSEEGIVSARGTDIAVLDDHPTQETQNIGRLLWDKLEVLTIDVSQFSLALLASDGSGIGFSPLVALYSTQQSLVSTSCDWLWQAICLLSCCYLLYNHGNFGKMFLLCR